jgi:hypothetical protein
MTDDPKRAQARRTKHTTNFSNGLARQMAPTARRDQRYEIASDDCDTGHRPCAAGSGSS